jgi:hypothetical protein
MDVLDPGHRYRLRSLDVVTGAPPVELQFVKREGEGYPGNVGSRSGTTTQEVLRALIDRTKYVDAQIHDPRNDKVLFHLRMAMFELEMRAAERHGRTLTYFDTDKIENQRTCDECNHIGCNGECR